eukprot:CAMPEP_0198293888 /NCGR_PEP_ID=MMETSP1449-20131203/19382_1 /TAXON_ID=420275 /ORGANISM="Attheya septentrionalis, Strain CCMP2084" /LENGTH=78 /DNA_ID=CAMNT_0043993641 /DNA_START=66 /DNA_END=299 /DNA_ORIENTATION=+
MRPSQGKTPSSFKKSIHRGDQALHAGVGAFHVTPIEYFDDHSSHNDRQRAAYETAPFESDEDERNTTVEYGKEYGDLA